ncbi:ROK family protein [Piscinibacter koreensis]|uniref:ROK family protein n=1 Tax=Piscinibacter koreensis TaxID=2742824 RepID=A0A7Y6NJH2_9BURK|nr:ROK family protein [Schlegelella koreensis]NUZ04239.1 ROK family protein [Schlegelella koreensis]
MRIGVDLGGTKIEAIALGGAGETLWRRRVATPAGDYAATLRTIAALVGAIERELGSRGSVGVGIPGALSRVTGRVKNANSTHLNDRALGDDLARMLARPVRVENDANCFALSEASDGAAAGARVVFGVILGTGVGGGLVVDGTPWTGADAIAGEWGHNEMPARVEAGLPDTTCWCGRVRCIETYVSGPGLATDHARRTGEHLDAAAIAAQAAAGDAAARATLERFHERLAGALGGVINVVDPDVVVLGGGLSNLDSLYAELPARLGRHVFSDRVATRIAKNRHGDSSGVRGAAWLWPADAHHDAGSSR